MKKWILAGAPLLLVALVMANLERRGERAIPVETTVVGRKHLVETVSASGKLTPKRKVAVSANTMGRITRLAVAEGDTVREGDFLLEIDPTQYTTALRGLEAALAAAEADLASARAAATRATEDLQRIEKLHAEGLASDQQLTEARTTARVQAAAQAAAEARVRQARANLDRARYDLSKVTITAPMSGVITRLNVEEGENAVVGTLNVPGTVLLEIADLATMEAEVDVDETEVVKLSLGQPVQVTVDAFPDTSFTGSVTEIGNSPIFSGGGQQQQAVDFKVTVTLRDRIAGVRPGLTAKAEITVGEADSALAVPIGAVVVRRWPPAPRTERRHRARRREAAAATDTVKRREREGVFVVDAGVARFRPLVLGLTGEDDFEVRRGLEGGETIVTGPFRVLRDLHDGDKVKPTGRRKDRRGGER